MDGIDGFSTPSLNWLPFQFPANFRVILSCSKDSDAFRNLKEHDWSKLLTLGALDEKEKRKVVAKCLAKYSKKLGSEQIHRLAWAPQTANPVFLKSVIEQLLILGDYEKLYALLQQFLKAPDVSRLFEQILIHWEKEYADQPNLVKDVMCTLYVSHTGLTESEVF